MRGDNGGFWRHPYRFVVVVVVSHYFQLTKLPSTDPSPAIQTPARLQRFRASARLQRGRAATLRATRRRGKAGRR